MRAVGGFEIIFGNGCVVLADFPTWAQRWVDLACFRGPRGQKANAVAPAKHLLQVFAEMVGISADLTIWDPDKSTFKFVQVSAMGQPGDMLHFHGTHC